MLSICGGAMRHYLTAEDELPEASVTAMAPISVRTEEERNTMGNQIAAMYLPHGSHLGDVGERMSFIVRESRRAKAMTDALGARQIAELAKLAPASVMEIAAHTFQRFKLADRTKPLVNTVVTNVPGPPVPLYSAGARAVSVYGLLCLMDGIRLGHIVHTFIDEVTISFTACREAMPDPEFYDECVQRSYEEHSNALMAQGTFATRQSKPGKARSRRKRSAKSESS